MNAVAPDAAPPEEMRASWLPAIVVQALLTCAMVMLLVADWNFVAGLGADDGIFCFPMFEFMFILAAALYSVLALVLLAFRRSWTCWVAAVPCVTAFPLGLGWGLACMAIAVFYSRPAEDYLRWTGPVAAGLLALLEIVLLARLVRAKRIVRRIGYGVFGLAALASFVGILGLSALLGQLFTQGGS